MQQCHGRFVDPELLKRKKPQALSFSEVKHQNGVYRGTVKDGVPHGTGLLRLPDGSIRQGQFSNGKLNGLGEVRMKNGVVQKGNFVNDLLDGDVTIEEANGIKISGIAFRGDVVGPVTITYPGGRTFDGMMVGKIVQPKGLIQYPDGLNYDGEAYKGNPYGKGIFYRERKSPFPITTKLINFAIGKKFKIPGFGDLYVTTNAIYLGKFKTTENGNGLKIYGTDMEISHLQIFNSETLIILSMGKMVEIGKFQNGKLEGWGERRRGYVCYRGEFVKGIAHGKGSLANAQTGETHLGYFNNGFLEGMGVKTKESEIYIGYFYDGREHGKGILYIQKSDPFLLHGKPHFSAIIHGRWQRGELVHQIKSCEHQEKIPNFDLPSTENFFLV